MSRKAYHGGAFFSAIGEDFSKFERHKNVINADVLDAWFDPSPKVLGRIKKFLPYAVKTSPPTHSEGLIATIAKYRKIPADNILVAGGSSDIIFTLFPHILKKGEKVLILDPMYGEYAHILEHVIGADVVRFKLSKEDGFVIDVEKFIWEVKKRRPAVVVLVNPNSPTGQHLSRENTLRIIFSLPKNTLAVVDETYIEYVNSHFSLEKNAVRLPNLIVIKSMSKVYALSGVRVGYLVAHHDVIEQIAPFIPPWSVSMIGQMAGIEALKDSAYYRKRYKETHRLREKLASDLRKIAGLKIYDSVANYLLIEVLDGASSAERIVQALRKKNIFLRNCDSMSVQFKNRFIRIAVKSAGANKRIVHALRETL